tara:strand:+ start:1140 stop:1619 length:480 start_codon:yes stop_codon:yes gene_type:complete
VSASVHFSSKSQEWETPQDLFDQFNSKFNFEVDVCATVENAKCSSFFSIDDDGLSKSWAPQICWCNPPYGRSIKHWIEKSQKEAELGATVVCLIPARPDTSYWHDFIFPFAEIHFIRGRLKFGHAKHGAPFPSAVVVFRPGGIDPLTRWDKVRRSMGVS